MAGSAGGRLPGLPILEPVSLSRPSAPDDTAARPEYPTRSRFKLDLWLVGKRCARCLNSGMGYFVWHDRENGYAGIMCNTSDVPLPLESFLGPEAEVQAEDFLAWLDCDPRTVPNLQGLQTMWWKEATDEDGEYIGTGDYAPGGKNTA